MQKWLIFWFYILIKFIVLKNRGLGLLKNWICSIGALIFKWFPVRFMTHTLFFLILFSNTHMPYCLGVLNFDGFMLSHADLRYFGHKTVLSQLKPLNLGLYFQFHHTICTYYSAVSTIYWTAPTVIFILKFPLSDIAFRLIYILIYLSNKKSFVAQ